MNTFPAGKTIVDAYRFTFGHLGTIIGLVWLPMVLATLLNFLPAVGGNYGEPASIPLTAGNGTIESVAISLLTQLIYSIIYVAVTRQALGLRQGPAMVHFALGLQEFRVFGAIILFVLAGFAAVLIYMMVLIPVAALAGMQGGSAVAAVAGGLIAFGGGMAIIYVMMRLGFFLVPVTVIENRVDLARGWALARGNFWRIILVLLAVVMPLLIVEASAILVLMGREIAAAMPPLGASEESLQGHMMMLKDVILHHMPGILGITLILVPFNFGLGVSASAFAYRSITAGSEGIRNGAA